MPSFSFKRAGRGGCAGIMRALFRFRVLNKNTNLQAFKPKIAEYLSFCLNFSAFYPKKSAYWF